jgi:hypothetical protein
VTRCPSDLELEALALGADQAAGHVRTCPRCTARLAELLRQGEEFQREVFPATVEAVVEGSAGRPRRPALGRWLAPLAAAAAVALLWVSGPLPRWLGRGGEELSLTAYAVEPGGARALADGAPLPTGADLRLSLTPSRSCKLFVVSADAAGQVSRLYPPAGDDGVSVEAGRRVEVAAAAPPLHPGPQRYFGLCGCGDDPLHYQDIHRAVRAVAAGEGKLRTARTLPGLPDDTLQATVLVDAR